MNNNFNFLLLQSINNLLTQIKAFIDTLKENYFFQISEKLKITNINTKFFWSFLMTKNLMYSTTVPK